jgi:putative ABC transport system substrate-binding protein
MNAGRWTGIALMLLAAAACPAVLAQPGPARIAFMANADDASTRSVVDAFRSGLGELGQVEGRTYVLDIRYGLGRSDRYSALVAEVVERGAAVIVTPSYPAALAAKQVTRTIPIAGFSCGLELLVDSLARPGGNVTGVTCQSVELVAKQFQLLRQMLPELKRLAVLSNPDSPYSEPTVRALRDAGSALGIRTIEIAVRSPADFGGVIAKTRQAAAQAVFIAPDLMLFANRAQLLDLFLAERLPVMGFFREFVDAGALLSYSSNRIERFRRLAWYVDRILRGTKPADLPVEQPTKFELVINLKTAKDLGLTVPPSVLARADEVIQ